MTQQEIDEIADAARDLRDALKARGFELNSGQLVAAAMPALVANVTGTIRMAENRYMT